MAASKLEILKQTTFGARIAEEEASELESYFVKTDVWSRIFAGNIDIIYGGKGAGKSAIYAVLEKNRDELFSRNVLLTTAENPRGTPVFKDLVNDPPTGEIEFTALWKLYLLSLVGTVFKDSALECGPAKTLVVKLEEAGLLEQDGTLRRKLKAVVDYVRRFLNVNSVSATVELDQMTGLAKGFTGKITLAEPTQQQRSQGFVSADTLFDLANKALEEEKFSIWILLDRLDVAFAESLDLEQNALRALFKVYLDLLAYPRLSLKIFIRTDIWRRITTQGFREASHITRHVTISWEANELLNLIIRRVLKNSALRSFYEANESEVLKSWENQIALFYRVFPEKVDLSDKKPTTLDWILSRCADGTKIPAPREIIHLLSSARDQQVRQLERGEAAPEGDTLFVGQSFKDALRDVSKTRFENTLLAEYPQYREVLLKLEGKRTQQTIESLAEIWSKGEEEVIYLATGLVDAGFFEFRATKEGKAYWIPFLYRPCLSLIQGTED